MVKHMKGHTHARVVSLKEKAKKSQSLNDARYPFYSKATYSLAERGSTWGTCPQKILRHPNSSYMKITIKIIPRLSRLEPPNFGFLCKKEHYPLVWKRAL